MIEPSSSASPPARRRRPTRRRTPRLLAWWRLDLVKLLVLAPLAFVLLPLFEDAIPSATDDPRGAAMHLLVPALLVVFLGWLRRRDRAHPIALGPRTLAYFLAFCVFTAFFAQSDLLRGKRVLLAGYEEALPGHPFGLARLGDWHYPAACPVPPANDLVVVTFESNLSREDLRLRFTALLDKIVEHGALGVAFDYYLDQETVVDQGFLAPRIERAEQAGIPVLFGEEHENFEGLIVRRPLVESVASVVETERRGHLAGYLESDGRLRLIPLDLPGVGPQVPALALRVAPLLPTLAAGSPNRPLPEDRLLRFVPPPGDIPVVPFDGKRDWRLLRDRFVFVGTASPSDARATPFGEVQGVVIHAWAAHNLRTGTFPKPLSSRWSYLLVVLGGWLLILLHVRAAKRRELLYAAAGLSLAVVVAAAALMRLGGFWLDIGYELAALWILTGGLLLEHVSPRAWSPGEEATPIELADLPEAPARTEPGTESPGFDVFLSHNSKDKATVAHLARALRLHGLAPWLDAWELVPGRPWQEALEDAIEGSRSCAVLVAKDGVGPWVDREMRAALSESVDRGMPVIPVLLPGAPDKPKLPLFLTQYTWVDLRGGITHEGLERLIWGITGVKPSRMSV